MNEVDKDIIYTAFRHLGWSAPDDVGSVLRGLYKQKLFDRVENGKFSLNHVGLDQALTGGDA